MSKWYGVAGEETVIYCDCFMAKNKKFLRNGCSIAVEQNNEIVFRGRYYLDDWNNDKMQKFISNYPVTNQVVEYFAMFCALRKAKEYKNVIVYSDSQLIVNQVNLDWEVGDEKLIIWNKICRNRKPKDVRVLWISRKKMVSVLGH